MADLILGLNGAGKGTIAQLLEERCKTLHLCSGDLLRHEYARGTKFGTEAHAYWGAGQYVPDNLMIHYFKDRLRNAHNALFDGFPRTEEQAKALDGAGIRFGHVIYLEVPEGIAEQRCLTRRLCSDLDCSRIYGEAPAVKTATPNQCDRCLGTLYQREDDKSMTKIRKRMDEFRTKTAKLLPIYRRKEILFTVDASQPVEVVYQDALKAIRT